MLESEFLHSNNNSGMLYFPLFQCIEIKALAHALRSLSENTLFM